MPCECKDWKENAPLIDKDIAIQAIRNGGIGYTGKQLKYCPWCGNLLNLINPKEFNSKQTSESKESENEKNRSI